MHPREPERSLEADSRVVHLSIRKRQQVESSRTLVSGEVVPENISKYSGFRWRF